MSWDTDLTAYVSDELLWDPRIDNVAIAVSAKDGNITLRGTVGSLLEKRRAYKAALRVFGAISVDNQLQVRLLTELRRVDADIRGVVLQALMLDSLVPKTVDARVRNGYVTLKGTVRWQYQRDEAGFVASTIVGALDVFNEIGIKHPASNAGDVELDHEAFKRIATIDDNEVTVLTDIGTVTNKGYVRSWPSRTRRPLPLGPRWKSHRSTTT